MGAKLTILILTDEAESSAGMAGEIAGALKGHKLKLRTGSNFEGTDLLPADAFFIGCEKPNPASFGYVEKLLRHINLAGRPCGVFSAGSSAAVKYLSRLVKDSEAAVYPAPLFPADNEKTLSWTFAVLEKKHQLPE